MSRDELAEILAAHRPGLAWFCACGAARGEGPWSRHLAAILADLLPLDAS